MILYICMPVLYVAIGYALIFFGGSEFLTMVKDQMDMAMTKGAPDYPNGFDKSLYERAVQDGNVEDWSEVPLPALNTSYAVLLSDDLGIEADVYYGDSDEDFASGVGQYVGSAMFGCGKPILIGGHDTTYFAGLEDAKAGDTFTVQTNYGQYQYEVTDTAVAKATDASAYDLTQDSEQLILYTCYPFGKITGERDERFFVYAKRIDDGPVIRQQTADATSDADAAEEMEVTEDEQ